MNATVQAVSPSFDEMIVELMTDGTIAGCSSLQEMEAAEIGVKPSQLTLAWVLSRGKDIVPIPGTKRRKYLEENIAAGQVIISPEELAEIAAVFPKGLASGERYPAYMMAFLNR